MDAGGAARGFFGVGYEANGGYNPLNPTLAVARCEHALKANVPFKTAQSHCVRACLQPNKQCRHASTRSVRVGSEPGVTAVLQASSQALAIFDGAGALLLAPTSLAAAFAPALPGGSLEARAGGGGSPPDADSIVDFPSAIFDPVARRWVLAAAYSHWDW